MPSVVRDTIATNSFVTHFLVTRCTFAAEQQLAISLKFENEYGPGRIQGETSLSANGEALHPILARTRTRFSNRRRQRHETLVPTSGVDRAVGLRNAGLQPEFRRRCAATQVREDELALLR